MASSMNQDKENLPPLLGRRENFAWPRTTKEYQNGAPREHLKALNPNTNLARDVGKIAMPEEKPNAAPIAPAAEIVMETDLDTDMSIDLSDILSPMSISYSLGSLSLSEEEAPPPPSNFIEVVEYQMDILKCFQVSETKYLVNPLYMTRQKDIDHKMRATLIDWLVDVNEEYNMNTETLYLTVSYIDRFLSQAAVSRTKLQLVGIAAMNIASKYEEIYPPNLDSFVAITDNSYTKRQLLHMEKAVLKILKFDLCTVTAYAFINAYSVMTQSSEKLKYLTLYLCELTLIEGDTYLKYLPSLISAASLALARHMLGMDIWTIQLEEITSYALDDLKFVILLLCKTHKSSKKPTNFQAIQQKYNTAKCQMVTSIDVINLTKKQLDRLCLASLCTILTPLKKDDSNKIPTI